jgi:hypothetical protein
MSNEVHEQPPAACHVVGSWRHPDLCFCVRLRRRASNVIASCSTSQGRLQRATGRSVFHLRASYLAQFKPTEIKSRIPVLPSSWLLSKKRLQIGRSLALAPARPGPDWALTPHKPGYLRVQPSAAKRRTVGPTSPPTTWPPVGFACISAIARHNQRLSFSPFLTLSLLVRLPSFDWEPYH